MYFNEATGGRYVPRAVLLDLVGAACTLPGLPACFSGLAATWSPLQGRPCRLHCPTWVLRREG